MARPKKADVAAENKLDESLLKRDPDAQGMPRISGMSETGYSGLKVISKQIVEDAEKEWRMPQRIKTIDNMCKDGYISAAIQFIILTLGQVEWKVEPPIGATDSEKERAKALNSMMDDMEHSWFSFCVSLLSSVKYGFSVHEKVYKRRIKGDSRYDDGLIGWHSFPSRAQSTLNGWEFSNDGRKLTAFLQSLDNIQYSERYTNISVTGQPIRIPREKFMLFRTSPQNDNPEGAASIKAAYTAWRYKKFIEEEEAKGIGRDLGGLLHLEIPAAYMSPDASPAFKAIYEDTKRAGRNISVGEQNCLVTASDCDETTKQKLFDVKLLTSQGSRGYDTNEIIQRYTSQMLVSMFADLLQLGNDATGSFALAGAKQDVIQLALTFRLKEIRDVLNSELIPQTYQMNGWSDSRLPTFEFGSIAPVSMDELGKFVQRVSAVSMIERDRPVLNIIRSAMGAQPYADDEEVHEEDIPGYTSGASEGMESGMPSGTGDATGKSGDSSVTNADNKA